MITGVRESDELRRCAFDRVITSIDSASRFPAQVFRGGRNVFFFFESDRLFVPQFAVVASRLLKAEQAAVCCLLNFSETRTLAYDSAAMLFIDEDTEPSEYDALLRQGGPAKGWLFGMDRCGIAPDRGGWSIYCEKGNDVAAIAVRQGVNTERYIESLQQLHAEPIATLLEAGSTAPVPFGQLTDLWRSGLSQHYAARE